jgi:hypothetical protein
LFHCEHTFIIYVRVRLARLRKPYRKSIKCFSGFSFTIEDFNSTLTEAFGGNGKRRKIDYACLIEHFIKIDFRSHKNIMLRLAVKVIANVIFQ